MPRTASPTLKPTHEIRATKSRPWTKIYVGDCRELLPRIPECARGQVDLVFADPPFNWNRDYDRHRNGDAWADRLPHDDYCDINDSFKSPEEVHAFTQRWLDLCIESLRPGGSLWVNIPDDWAAEIVVHIKARGLDMINWCVWHYRFGQNTKGRFINSKVHALFFAKPDGVRTWNPEEVAELSDRRAIYFDARTEEKRDGMPPGLRVPMDVWYGKFWGRIQGNNKERRGNHDNQLPEVYLERVVRACSNEGDLVLDPFLGSGTTGLIAHALGRRFIGTEFTPANAKSAFQRIKDGPVRVTPGPHVPGSTAIFPARTRRKPGEDNAE